MTNNISLHKNFITSLIIPRKPDSHKGNYGHALLIAGSERRMGAAVLSARACLRTGSGLLTVCVPKDERFILQTAIPEAMLIFREEKINTNNYSAIGIGPALGTRKDSIKILKSALTKYNPIVLDADALNILANNTTLWTKIPANAVITPHAKEFDRIAGICTTHEERVQKAIQLAIEKNIVLVLKGHQTIVTQKGKIYMNTTGNAGLAKGGSGDVLTGMITALLAQGYSSLHAACIGVYLHGLAADTALKYQSMESMLATDVIECIGEGFKSIKN